MCSGWKTRVTAADAAGASNLRPCLRRGVDGPRRVAGDGRAHLHGGLVPEAPVEAQRVRRNKLHEALLPHAVVVIIGHYDVPELLLGRGLDGISALGLEREALCQLALPLCGSWVCVCVCVCVHVGFGLTRQLAHGELFTYTQFVQLCV